MKPEWPLQKPSVDRKKIFRRVKKAERDTTRHAQKFVIKRLDSIRMARRHIIQWLLLVGILITATGFQLSWSQSGYQTIAPAHGGTYAEAVTGQVDTLNPLYAASEAEVATASLMFSSLYDYDVSGSLSKSLAKSMDVSEDGKVYTVKLHSDVYWHDGETLTAEDVVFTVNLIKDPSAMSRLRTNWQDISIQALDDQTVEFRLPAEYAAFSHALTFSILPSHILREVPAGSVRENTFSRQPVGSGPFSFRLLQSVGGGDGNKIIQMSAFDKHFKGAPKVSRFEIHAYGDREQAVRSLRQGAVNAVSGVPMAMAEDLQNADYKVSFHDVQSGVYALFNSARPTLKDKSVRKALQLATDTEALRNQLSVDVSRLDLPFAAGQLTGDGIPEAPDVNIKKASELLSKAGWKLSDGVRQKGDNKLSLTITTTKDSQYEKIAEGLAAQWRSLGIEVNNLIIDTSTPGANFVQSVLQPRNYDVLIYELLIGSDPDVYAYWHSSQVGSTGYNFSNYSNPVADAALVSARSRIESDLRNAKYKTFAEVWLDDAPAIGIYQPVSIYASGRHVNSLIDGMPLVTPADHYANVLDWSVRERTVYRTP